MTSVPMRVIAARFLVIGATTFGGGVIAYLQVLLVERMKWMTPDEFMSALEISQSLPGLNATNMAVLSGDRLRHAWGAFIAVAAIILPGAVIVFILGRATLNGEAPWVVGLLAGVMAAATGLLLAVTLKLAHPMFGHIKDVALALVTVVMVSVLHIPLIVVLLVMIPIGIWVFRPRRVPAAVPEQGTPAPNRPFTHALRSWVDRA